MGVEDRVPVVVQDRGDRSGRQRVELRQPGRGDPVGQRGGLQLAAIGRIGDDWDKGSLQLDLSYPLRPLLRNNIDVFLHAQFFTGYGESLLDYNESDTTFRVGLAVVR
jgi:hypothetical protein